MRRSDFTSRLRSYAFHLMSRRSWAKEEFRQKLVKYLLKRKKEMTKEGEGLIDNILSEMEEMGLLDDREFAGLFVRHSLSFRKRGIAAVKKELQRKGVEEGIIEEVIKGEGEEEAAIAKKLIGKYQKRYEKVATQKNLSGQKRKEFVKKKLQEVLLRRGFRFEVIERVLGEFLRSGQ
ncbi:MAG: regulatory protein RecX [candidate division WOR-3 bacterium]